MSVAILSAGRLHGIAYEAIASDYPSPNYVRSAVNINPKNLSLLAPSSLLLLLLLLLLANCGVWRSNAQDVISLDSSVRYQTIEAWEATAQAGQVECASFASYADQVMDLAADELGITRLRVEIRPSSEYPEDTYQPLLDGEMEYADWRKVRYKTINDNADPNLINWDGFYFTELDHTIEHVAMPLQQRLRARGEPLAINVNYVAFTGPSPEGYVHEDPQEYAEFVLATYLHLQQKYGLVPDAWEVILEPDNRTPWDGRDIGEAIVAAGKNLEAHGFTPAFIAPSTTSTKNASTFIDAMMQVEGVLPYLREFSYHRYQGAMPENVRRIAERGQRFGVPTAMLEYMEANYKTLHEDLTVGQNASWQHYPLAYCDATSGSPYINVDTSDPEQPVVRLSPNGRYYQQYFRYVRPGAVRIGSSTTSRTFDPVAFINPDGGYAIVVKADSGGVVAVTGLPAGTYGVTSTTEGAQDGGGEGIAVSERDTLRASIPGKGVLTIFKTSDAVPAALDGAGS